jgi:hypothetical protein
VLLAYQTVITPTGATSDGIRASLPTCTATYVARGTLARPGAAVREAACRRPAIVAPPSVRVLAGDAVIRVQLSCGGDLLPGRTVDVFVAKGSHRQRVGSFKTLGRLRLVLHRLASASWDSVLIGSRAGDVFRASRVARIALRY